MSGNSIRPGTIVVAKEKRHVWPLLFFVSKHTYVLKSIPDNDVMIILASEQDPAFINLLTNDYGGDWVALLTDHGVAWIPGAWCEDLEVLCET